MDNRKFKFAVNTENRYTSHNKNLDIEETKENLTKILKEPALEAQGTTENGNHNNYLQKLKAGRKMQKHGGIQAGRDKLAELTKTINKKKHNKRKFHVTKIREVLMSGPIVKAIIRTPAAGKKQLS